MAEVITAVGIAASIVQLVGAATKLKATLDQFRDAPSDLAQLVKHVSASSRHLARNKRYFEEEGLLDDDLLLDCTEYVEGSLLSVSTVSKALAHTLQRSKKLGSLRYIFKAEEVKKACRHLERAQDMMDRAERLVDRIHRQRHAEILTRTNEVVERLINITEIDNLLRCATEYEDHDLNAQSLSRKLRDQGPAIRTKCPLGSERRHYTFKIALPPWLWSRHYQFTLQQHESRTIFSMESYNTHLQDSDVVSAIWRQDIPALRSYLESRVIRAFDAIHAPGCASHGDSLLDEAISKGLLEVVELFLADKWFTRRKRDYAMITFRTLVAFQQSMWLHGPDVWQDSPPARKFLEQLDIFEPEDEDDLDTFADNLLRSPLYCARDVYDLLCTQPQITRVMLGSTEPSPQYRAFQAMCADCPSGFEDVLDGKLSRREAFQICAANQAISHRRLLKRIYRDQEDCAAEWPPWSDIIGDLLSFESLQEYQDPDLPRLNDMIWNPGTDRRFLQKWLSYVQDLGIDLETFGETESVKLRLMRDRWFRGTSILIPGFDEERRHQRLIRLTYGSQPSDWAQYWAPHGWEYEWAGDFWNWIENPEDFMPGAYTETLYDGD
jgi:hypothetical protein